MNDNAPPDPREKLIAEVLRVTVVVEEHLTRGLPAMLSANGFTREFQEVVGEFVKPVVAILDDLERSIIGIARGVPTEELRATDAFADRTDHLVAWAETFSRLAETPAAIRAARGFREFVDDMTRIKGTEPEKGKEPQAKDMDLER